MAAGWETGQRKLRRLTRRRCGESSVLGRSPRIAENAADGIVRDVVQPFANKAPRLMTWHSWQRKLKAPEQSDGEQEDGR